MTDFGGESGREVFSRLFCLLIRGIGDIIGKVRGRVGELLVRVRMNASENRLRFSSLVHSCYCLDDIVDRDLPDFADKRRSL